MHIELCNTLPLEIIIFIYFNAETRYLSMAINKVNISIKGIILHR